MADDSWEIETSLNFHPCDKPHGLKDFILADLTPEQQTNLNQRKTQQIRTDQQYLAAHPEIRGLIVMILRLLMKTKPQLDIYEVIGRYFLKSSVDLKEEIFAYLEERKTILSANSTTIFDRKERSSKESDIFPLDITESIEGEEEEEGEGEEGVIPDYLSLSIKEQMEETESARERRSTVISTPSNICQEVMDNILQHVFEEIDAASIGSIASIASIPVDYEDHAVTSNSEESID